MLKRLLNLFASKTPPRVMVNSVPKSGTHLVGRALELMGMDVTKPHDISAATAGRFSGNDGPQVPIGVSAPIAVSLNKLAAALREVGQDEVVMGHVPYSPGFAHLLEQLDYRMLLVIRDPRDIAVSLAFHIANVRENSLYDWAQSRTHEQRIEAAIRGIPVPAGSPPMLLDINARFRTTLPWSNHRNVLLIRFEDIIGARGGGSDARQAETLNQIAHHIRRPSPDLPAIQRGLFGDSATFRKGTTAQWRDHFTATHHTAMRELAGDLLNELRYTNP